MLLASTSPAAVHGHQGSRVTCLLGAASPASGTWQHSQMPLHGLWFLSWITPGVSSAFPKGRRQPLGRRACHSRDTGGK